MIRTWICSEKMRAMLPFLRAKFDKLPEHQKPGVLILLIFLGVILSFLFIKGCVDIIRHANTAPQKPLLIRQGNQIIIPEHSPLREKIVIKPIKATRLAHDVSFPGLIEAEPSKVINVLPPVTGRLIELKARLGQQVAKDQVLGVIESADLALAYADHNKAVSAQTFAHDTLKRAQQVYRAGGNSIKDIEAAQTNFLQAEAELKRTDATLKTLGQHTFSLLTIKAPISGQIIAMNDGVGSYITDLTAPILTIANTDELWVTAYISERLAGAIQKNLLAEVSLPAYPGQHFKGTVTFVSSFLDADTRRNKTRIAFVNPKGKFQPNMFATVKIAIPQPDQIIIPPSAILMSNDSTSVFVEQAPWTFIRRNVCLGMEDGEHVRILSGLKAGERVVISGGVLVND